MLAAVLASPTKYQIIFLNSFPFDWCFIPLLLLGALTSPCAPFQWVDDEIPIAYYCLQYLPGGINQWLLL